MSDYNEDSIRSLQWNVHLRERPGMYIGKLGDGSETVDGHTREKSYRGLPKWPV